MHTCYINVKQYYEPFLPFTDILLSICYNVVTNIDFFNIYTEEKNCFIIKEPGVYNLINQTDLIPVLCNQRIQTTLREEWVRL